MRGRGGPILLLAGAGEARRLAALLAEDGLAVTASLAGATAHPAPYPCPTRVGGFGGAEGLARHLRETRTAAVIDATHPFAARISANAARAARAVGAPLARLARPAWVPPPGARWRAAASAQDAARLARPGARALLALGRGGGAEAFAHRRDLWRALRVAEPPDPRLAATMDAVLVARPPHSLAAERATLRETGATLLVARNAGGAAGYPKIAAAAELGVEMLLIAPPPPPREGVALRDLTAARAWARGVVGA